MDFIFRHSYSDIGLIVGVLIIVVIGIMKIIQNRRKINSYKQALNLIFLGIVFLLVAVVVKCLISGRCDKEYVIAFLSFVQIGREFITQGIALLGYMFLFFGITTLIIALINRFKERDHA